MPNDVSEKAGEPAKPGKPIAVPYSSPYAFSRTAIARAQDELFGRLAAAVANAVQSPAETPAKTEPPSGRRKSEPAVRKQKRGTRQEDWLALLLQMLGLAKNGGSEVSAKALLPMLKGWDKGRLSRAAGDACDRLEVDRGKQALRTLAAILRDDPGKLRGIATKDGDDTQYDREA